MAEKRKAEFSELVELMARLRGPGGCPWDREQTRESLKPYIVEEAHEVVEAIEEGDRAHLCEELGDLLFQIIFQAQLAAEQGAFNISDVIAAIHEKMTRRHPHVFGNVTAGNADEVRHNWARIKEAEGKKEESVLGHLPRSTPALLRARRLTMNAREVGFDWNSQEDVIAKFEEEWEELKESIRAGNRPQIEDEFGDVLFVLVNLSRFLDLDPEQALHRATDKFVRRFHYMEERAQANGQRLEDMTLEEMDRYWEEAKKKGL